MSRDTVTALAGFEVGIGRPSALGTSCDFAPVDSDGTRVVYARFEDAAASFERLRHEVGEHHPLGDTSGEAFTWLRPDQHAAGAEALLSGADRCSITLYGPQAFADSAERLLRSLCF